MNRETQVRIIDLLIDGNTDKATAILRNAGGHWWKFGSRLIDYIEADYTTSPPFAVINSIGNIKLPFAEFSTLPGYTCPGAGDCLEYCYSYKAWRYPAAFFRQVQNSLLILAGKYDVLRESFDTIKPGAHLRLYVNGDVDSLATLEFWFNCLESRPDVQAYGYSKSWDIFLSYKGKFPKNYVLNISNGSIYDDAKRMDMLELPCTRGEFLGVPIDHKLAGKYGTKEYKQAVGTVWSKPGEKSFLCPGRCGTCTKSTHACGDHRFDDIPILIGIH